MTVTVRTATLDDLEAVVAVGHRTWPVTYGPIAGDDYVAMGLAKWWSADACESPIRRGHTLVAEVDGEVVGVSVTGAVKDEVVLWKLYVVPEHHGAGVGTALLAEAVERAREHGYTVMRLAHADGNDAAHGFYAAHGFVDDHRETEADGIPDSMWMRRDL